MELLNTLGTIVFFLLFFLILFSNIKIHGKKVYEKKYFVEIVSILSILSAALIIEFGKKNIFHFIMSFISVFSAGISLFLWCLMAHLDRIEDFKKIDGQ